MDKKFKYIYGPVFSWRLGSSLGIDPISTQDKICNFDCVYCQLGQTTHFSNDRKVYVQTREIIDEVNSFPKDSQIDFITFSGRGEPTLAKNLGEMIKALKETRQEKIAVITNSSLMHREDVQEDLSLADVVLAKLDACSKEMLFSLNKAVDEIDFESIVQGIKLFKKSFAGKLCLQIMFVENNLKYAKRIADIAREISPDEVEINTPLRPSATRALTRDELQEVKKYFKELNFTFVYDVKPQEISPIDEEDTVNRHGQFRRAEK